LLSDYHLSLFCAQDLFLKKENANKHIEEKVDASTPKTPGTAYVDEDEKCCVCGTPDSIDTNMIIFCDGCNIAVHQWCYGVPVIPQGIPFSEKYSFFSFLFSFLFYY